MIQRIQLLSLLSYLGQVTYAGFVVQYMLDANLLALGIKCISQLQFSAPKTHHPDRSLRFHISACAFVNVFSLLYHLTIPLQRYPRGIIIDFIGQGYLPNRFQLLVLDICIAALQALSLILAFEVGHFGDEADLDDGSDIYEEEDEEADGDAAGAHEAADNGEISTGYVRDKTSMRDKPLFDLRFRPTLHRIIHDKPVTASAGDGIAAPTASAASLTRLRLMRARIRARARQAGSIPQTGQQEDRGDEGSDEEREIGNHPGPRVDR